MNSLIGIFTALALLVGGGYALSKILKVTKRAAVENIHHGMPSLSEFTSRLTCSKITTNGELVRLRCEGRK